MHKAFWFLFVLSGCSPSFIGLLCSSRFLTLAGKPGSALMKIGLLKCNLETLNCGLKKEKTSVRVLEHILAARAEGVKYKIDVGEKYLTES